MFGVHPPPRHLTHLAWTMSSDGWVKANSDGSVVEHVHVHAACGGLIRDSGGAFLRGFSVNLGRCLISTIAEVWGVFYALDLAWSMGFRCVFMELDSSAALCLIRKPLDRSHPYASLIGRVQDLLHRDWEVVLSHIYREVRPIFLPDVVTLSLWR